MPESGSERLELWNQLGGELAHTQPHMRVTQGQELTIHGHDGHVYKGREDSQVVMSGGMFDHFDRTTLPSRPGTSMEHYSSSSSATMAKTVNGNSHIRNKSHNHPPRPGTGMDHYSNASSVLGSRKTELEPSPPRSERPQTAAGVMSSSSSHATRTGRANGKGALPTLKSSAS